MGEAATDARREVEATREELGETIGELRRRGEHAGDRVRRALPYVIGGAAASAGVAVAVVIIVRRRGGPLAQAAGRLPQPARGVAVPAARRTERWAERRADRLRKQRDELAEMVAERIAENQATAERKANPLWRRTAAKALETAATVGVAAAVRQATGAAGARRQREVELSGAAR